MTGLCFVRPAGVVAFILTLFLAGGCGSLLPNQATSYYLLQDLRAAEGRTATPPSPSSKAATAAPPASPAPSAPTMLISVNPASTLYESAGIVFSRGPSERAYYQLGSWSERPSRRLGLMIEHRLVKAIAAGLPLAGVALDTSGVRGDWLLGVRLIELYHDTTTQPDRAVVTVEAELIDWERRKIIDRAAFSTQRRCRASRSLPQSPPSTRA